MATDLEDLQLQLEKELCEVGQDVLVKLAVFLNCEEVKYEGKSRLGITRLLRREIEEQTAGFEDENECRSFIGKLREKLFEDKVEEVDKAPSNETQTVNKELEVLKQQLSNLEKDHQKKVEALQTQMGETELQATNITVSKPISSELQQVLRRELKINGQIGEPGQRDKLTFVSLVKQIESALTRGYQESEVCDAVIRAITPSMQLRSYLETTSNLTLARLRCILRSHFQEKSSTELYQELATIVQAPQESPQSFLIRALDLRQKVLVASKEVGTMIKYDESLVQGLFLHSLETGLQQEAVRTKLRQYLQQSEITDELLIEQMNRIVSTEVEREKKIGSGRQRKVNQVTTNAPSVPHVDDRQEDHLNPTAKTKKEPKKGEFLSVLETVKAEIAELRETIVTQQGTKPAGRQPSYKNEPTFSRRRVCAKCQEANETNCEHCFRCGSSDHYARGCKKRQNSGNGQWLPPRDRK